jgi:hypothetical protein
MADVIQGTQQEFWRPPSVLAPEEAAGSAPSRDLADACACGSEFMIGAKFCHTCGLGRPALSVNHNNEMAGAHSEAVAVAGFWVKNVAWARVGAGWVADAWSKIPFPAWLRYLHFHEIKRWVGLPTAALVAFIIGLGCVAGAVGVSLFYKASNLAEFQAIQMWRMEWLLAATASFVAGILLKKPSDSE